MKVKYMTLLTHSVCQSAYKSRWVVAMVNTHQFSRNCYSTVTDILFTYRKLTSRLRHHLSYSALQTSIIRRALPMMSYTTIWWWLSFCNNAIIVICIHMFYDHNSLKLYDTVEKLPYNYHRSMIISYDTSPTIYAWSCYTIHNLSCDTSSTIDTYIYISC